MGQKLSQADSFWYKSSPLQRILKGKKKKRNNNIIALLFHKLVFALHLSRKRFVFYFIFLKMGFESTDNDTTRHKLNSLQFSSFSTKRPSDVV